MQKKWLVTLNIFVLIVVSFILVFVIWRFSINPEVAESTECLDVNNVASFVYDLCYDAYSKNIFLSVRRGSDNYRLNSFEFSFFDFSQQEYEMTDIPEINEVKAYKIPAEKNPQNFYVRMNVVKDFSTPICEDPRNLFVKYCPVGSEDIEVSISPLMGVELEDFVEIVDQRRQDSDVFALNLVDKEAIWESKCKSKWKCSTWGTCENGIQKRTCEDLENCLVPTDMPDEVKYCDGTCEERWECTWSDCRNGFAVPTCKDLNRCGTSYTIPQKLNCDKKGGCVPDVTCSEWSYCEVSYNFVDLVQGSISEIEGTKFRTCQDSNNCMQTKMESQTCSVGVDVYTRRFTKCGIEFIGIYNKLSNELISRIDRGTEENQVFNIYLSDGSESDYCDYCFDGVKDGDEEGVDCGGSCEECSEVYKETMFRKDNWWNNFLNWVKKMLS